MAGYLFPEVRPAVVHDRGIALHTCVCFPAVSTLTTTIHLPDGPVDRRLIDPECTFFFGQPFHRLEGQPHVAARFLAARISLAAQEWKGGVQIAKRRNVHQDANPDCKIISLGIGDTTEPLTPTIVKAMSDAALGFGTREGYSGCAVTAAAAT